MTTLYDMIKDLGLPEDFDCECMKDPCNCGSHMTFVINEQWREALEEIVLDEDKVTDLLYKTFNKEGQTLITYPVKPGKEHQNIFDSINKLSKALTKSKLFKREEK